MTAYDSATIFRVLEVGNSIRFYVGTLGFTVDFHSGDYACLRLGDVKLHLAGPQIPNPKKIGEGAIYIFCQGLDEYYQTIVEKGAKTLAEPKEYPYGLRDFIAVDLDDNLLIFAEDLSPKEE